MFKRFKSWFLKDLERRIESLEIDLVAALPEEPPKDSLDLLRRQLGSIDLSDVEEDEEMSESERKEYCAAIFAVFPRIEKDIKKFLYKQLLFASNEAATWEQVIFGRGTFNGMDLLLDYWRKAQLEHIPPPKEEFDKNNPIGEIN